MSIPRTPARAGTLATPAATDSTARTAMADGPLHIVYVSGGTDLEATVAHVQQALDRHGLRHASVIADSSLGTTPPARKQAFLDQLRALFESGQIGPDTRVIVQLHGGEGQDGFHLQASEVIDDLPWEELRMALRRPSGSKEWHGDVILGCCEAGRLENSLPTDEGSYFLLAGKKSLPVGALREQLTTLFNFFGAHVRKKHRMPSSQKTWEFLTQISGENLRRVDALGKTRTKAGEVYVRKPRMGETGKRALKQARARQPSQLLISKLLHGSVRSVAKVLQEHGSKALKDPLLEDAPALSWLPYAERDVAEKAALLFAAGQTDIRIHGHTLLHMATQRNLPDLMRTVLAQDVDVDQPNQIGRTALHTAAALGRLAIARLLLEYGAKASAVDRFGKTPLQYAEENKHDELIRLLRPQKANG